MKSIVKTFDEQIKELQKQLDNYIRLQNYADANKVSELIYRVTSCRYDYIRSL